uniref:CBM1 domain-containing protein n=1 Tax=Alexandrium monilatum TaxID=311494 RepID=A0A7S4PSS8_9DINO|mmetsp:Transcript_41636/g.129774  ORF Transcript_41636/g.129774 Transcript_41636/m.129774 type:complete len:416 (+) Transcript_41636:47-1294(+)
MAGARAVRWAVEEQDFDSDPEPSRCSWRRALRCGGAAGLLGLLALAALLLRRDEGAQQASAGTAAGPGGDSVALRGTVELEADSDCKGSTAWCSRGEVSLYCFSQVVADGLEEELVKQQLKHGVSIFACDDFTVTCKERRLLGTDKDGKEVHTVVNPESGKVQKGDVNSGATTSSFLNVLIFMKAWDILIQGGKVWKHDWTVKCDPDAVFFPTRLRSHLKAHTGGSAPPTYTLNCREKQWTQDDSQGNGHIYFTPKLYGAVEVYNMKALGAYKDAHERCLTGLNWRQWGEDLYMFQCMKMLGSQPLVDYRLVGDNRCVDNPPSTCSEANRPAYHPYKGLHEWFSCWNQSMGIQVPSEEPAVLATSGVTAKPFGSCGGQGKTERPCPKGYQCHHASKWYWQCLQKTSNADRSEFDM